MKYFTSHQWSSKTLYAGPYNNGNHIAAGNLLSENAGVLFVSLNKDNGKTGIRTFPV